MAICCAPGLQELRQTPAAPPSPELPERDVSAFVREEGGRHRLDLMVEGITCGACLNRIEQRLKAFPEVETARLNLGSRRLALEWAGEAAAGGGMLAAVEALGYRLIPFDPARLRLADRHQETELLRALAVAGFAAGNVMLLSVSVWAGHWQGMGEATRTLLHWFSALIAVPAVAYCGRPFFTSAWQALRHGRTNMDVPISIGVVLALAASIGQTLEAGEHAYFDAAVTLLFFLLIGRYLDLRARGQARSGAERLLTLAATAATILDAEGRRRSVPVAQVAPGTAVLVATGERLPVDGRVQAGVSELDTSLVTGETAPRPAGPGDLVYAGTLNLGGPLRLEATGAGEATLLAEIVRLMDAAEQRRGRYVAIADRAARYYAPVVHSLALLTFLGWWLIGGATWPTALMTAIAVLIVTCPCAIGLAVPAVQVVAAGRLMRRGILLKAANALERFAEIDMVVFDKTGTLTLGDLALARHEGDAEDLALAAGMAARSRHPLAMAIARAAPDAPPLDGVEEVAGSGLRLTGPEGEIRLGSRRFAGVTTTPTADLAAPELWLARPGRPPVRFVLSDRLRPDAGAVVQGLDRRGLAMRLLSGDRAPAVEQAADSLGIAERRAECTPAGKVAELQRLAAAGRRVLMVGDGLNDAPALAEAHVSLSPASAADLSQNAADAVFQGDRLAPVLETIDTARQARALVRQNFGLAILYNIVTIPVAMAGLLTPLLAAIFMSGSSILVVLNALRLGRR